MIGFGTYRIPVDKTEELVNYAVKIGCKLIDTAQQYGNSHIVAKTLENIEYENKFNNVVNYTDKIHKKLIKNSQLDNRSIELSYYNIVGKKPSLLLLHSPEKNYQIAWEQIKRIPNIKLGVSNFSKFNIENLSSIPEVNQIEVNCFNTLENTVNYCLSKNIEIQAHSSLCKAELLDTDVLVRYSLLNELTPAQTMIAWSLKKNYIPLFSSKNIFHINEIFNPVNLFNSLDYSSLDNLNINYKTHPQYLLD
jgi:diketogulonate reductase-like aldo/keto reductase